jgi:RNA polymerase sigma-70 factor, ECF subfamily
VKADSAFERFYMNEARGVFTAVYLMCRDRALAEDSTQEAFARALERWDRLDQQPWAAGWAMSTALNVARRSLRRRRAWPIAGQIQNPDESVDLWTAVRRLPQRQHEAVVLHYRMGLPVTEIAQILNCREGTVRTHLARARCWTVRACTRMTTQRRVKGDDACLIRPSAHNCMARWPT